MKKVFIQWVFLLLACIPAVSQTKIDTAYYDLKGRGCEPAFASYYRIYNVPADSNAIKRFRTFFITGEVKSEGEYVSIDKLDDAKSVFDGEYVNYFKSGKIEQKGCSRNGVNDGEFTKYDENGLILVHAFYNKGLLDGIYTEFTKDNLCYQLEYVDGKPATFYYTLSNQDGFCSKVSLSNDLPIYESPLKSEVQLEYKDGDPWLFYNKNGFMVATTNKKNNDYGKYFQLSVMITNNSLFPLEFDPADVHAVLTDENGEPEKMEVLQIEDYLKKIKRRQNAAVVLAALGEGISAAGAGYSTSRTHTQFSGMNGNSFFSGSATSTTTSYNAFAAYQASVISSACIASFHEELLSDREAKSQGYLKRVTIYPGESVSGFINIERKQGNQLNVSVPISAAKYTFLWDVSRL